FGNSVPSLERVARDLLRQEPQIGRAELLDLAESLWKTRIHDCRMVACQLLAARIALLGPPDIALVERFLRSARTWALVDTLAIEVAGGLVARYPELGDALDRWARDEDFWLRR